MDEAGARKGGDFNGSSTAGPWLRYGGGCSPTDNAWRGSVLFAERVQGPRLATAAATTAPREQGRGGRDAAAQQQAGTQQEAATGAGEVASAAAAADAAAEPLPPETPSPPAQPAATPHRAQQGQQPPRGAPALQLSDAGSTGEQQVTPVLLDCVGGWAFWRFDLRLPLAACQREVRYSVLAAGGSCGREFAFWLPALQQPMHWGFQSCNGFSASVPADAPERADPTYLWRDLLQLHAAFPLHCLVGGGDQVYSDGVFRPEGSAALHAWGNLSKHRAKLEAIWTPDMEEQATACYLRTYLEAFTQPDVGAALACIPQLMMWDDHDIWDGWGSYDADLQACPVFQGLFRVARRLFLLFQQHTSDAHAAQAAEFLAADGSSFHLLRYMGPQVALLAVDMRSERSRARILPPRSLAALQAAVDGLAPGVQHLVVLSGVPLVFPAVPLAERLLSAVARLAKAMPRFLHLARATGLMDRFDQPEILDDLRDGWVANCHAAERLEFVRLLQRWATERALRVTVLSGDAHVAGVGRLYSRRRIRPICDDPLFMPQIISSAIMNAPPPHGVLRMLVRTNFSGRLDKQTKEKMVSAFYPSHPRTDKLLALRNWCDVSLIAPPFSPPMHPSDPLLGGLRFVLRAETPRDRRGHAEELYVVTVPRHPLAAKVLVGTGAGAVPGGGADVAGGDNGAALARLCTPLFLQPELQLQRLKRASV